jgi:hypothetical protein
MVNYKAQLRIGFHFFLSPSDHRKECFSNSLPLVEHQLHLPGNYLSESIHSLVYRWHWSQNARRHHRRSGLPDLLYQIHC